MASHHKDAPGRGARVAAGRGLTRRLILVGFAMGKDGVLMEGMHQVGIHVAKEEPHLREAQGDKWLFCVRHFAEENTASYNCLIFVFNKKKTDLR